MQTLWLLRHTKSSWSQPDLDDFERPLSRRGERAAAVLGVYFVQHGVAPQRIVCSTARRTQQTVEQLLPYLKAEPEVVFERGLYEAGVQRLLGCVREYGEGKDSLMLVGHNPGLQELALSLCEGGHRHQLDRLHKKLPTGGLLELSLPDLTDLQPGVATLESFVSPKQLV